MQNEIEKAEDITFPIDICPKTKDKSHIFVININIVL
jgi:hypothetical protein